MSEAQDALDRNIERALTTDFPTGIRTDMTLYVVAKDLDAGMILVGGYGPFGVGEMWEPFDETHHPRLAGWTEARVERCDQGKAFRESVDREVDVLRRKRRKEAGGQ